jgi:tRNA (mo5U34)-methyltransferase
MNPTLLSLHRERLAALSAPKFAENRRALETLNPADPDSVWESARGLMPWKKGPFQFFGQELDAEWRCDKKWARLAPHLGNLTGQTVLDVGCNNGWYMQQLRESGAARVVGLDPVGLNWFQWQFLQKLRPDAGQEFYLLGIEDVPALAIKFDTILSLGVLYHHRSPLQQLIDLREGLNPGGTLFLETIGVPGDGPHAYLPADRYANMPNVWFLPTLSCLRIMLERARFTDVEVLSTSWDGVAEQRATPWTTGPSYRDTLSSLDSTKTIEGHPAPERFLLRARRKSL